jgi:hypothetical protein
MPVIPILHLEAVRRQKAEGSNGKRFSIIDKLIGIQICTILMPSQAIDSAT